MQQSDQHNTDVVETHSAAVLNVTEACAELRVSRWTLYELIRSRKLSTRAPTRNAAMMSGTTIRFGCVPISRQQCHKEIGLMEFVSRPDLFERAPH